MAREVQVQLLRICYLHAVSRQPGMKGQFADAQVDYVSQIHIFGRILVNTLNQSFLSVVYFIYCLEKTLECTF